MKILSSIPGRVRLQVEEVYKDESQARAVRLYLQQIDGVINSRVNHINGSITLNYDYQQITFDNLQDKIEDIIVIEKSNVEEIDRYYQQVLPEEEQLGINITKTAALGGLYLLFKGKELLMGKFSPSQSIIVLSAAAIITIIKEYPGLDKLYRKLSKYFPTAADKILVGAGFILTLVREGNSSILLLFLKALTDTLKSYYDLKTKKMLIQNSPNSLGFVWKGKGEEKKLLPLSQIKSGDMIMIASEETITVNGKVTDIEGVGLVDETYCNGQPEIRRLKVGDQVCEGMVVEEGQLEIEVSQVNPASLKPDALLEDLKIGKRVTKYQKRALPISLALAGAGVLVTGSPLTGMAVLLLMSPAASGISLQSNLSKYLKLLSDNKISFRNVHKMEKLLLARTIVFDKTGTLTKQKLEIDQVKLFDDSYSEEEVLDICAACEADNHHPVASAFKQEGVEEAPNTVYIPSRGVKADYDNRKVIIGSATLLKEEGIELEKRIDNYLPVYLAVDGKPVAVISLVERVEDNAVEMVNQLKNLGFKIAVISGDLERNVKRLADELKIDHYQGQLTKEEKKEYILAEQKRGPVIMVGDGINDTQAMQSADVSISYCNHACDQALLQADCLLQDKDLLSIPQLICLSSQSYDQMEHGIIFSQIYNYVYGLIGMTGFFNPFQAKSINTFNSIVAVI